ncbi:NAD(P)-dependent oxidoreductase [Pararobbsia silviterrae]|uniref:NAD(P)-dependent oxidoreductase n=1 Tax=Pararobbsia silviterrae TaxID=1792498 RepID=A0A494Y8L4_9BURK|nr:NAD(P)-dependent oxidoreductase [Pararobbsia silviterrae]RKP56646.1 NAD(P)-dependent oxidoreductase [Pararobbsia silviterrae]
MKVALIGITGRQGSRLATELLSRGHEVTGIARKASDVAPQKGLTVKQADATQPSTLVPVIAGHDAVISASRFQSSDANALTRALADAGVKRLLVVGGAASLEAAPGKRLLDSPDFPDAYRPEATAGAAFLEALRTGDQTVDWTFLSPPALLEPGTRTGQYRLGTDNLIVAASGKSAISMEDYAIALVDELEKHAHSRKRFSVGY